MNDFNERRESSASEIRKSRTKTDGGTDVEKLSRISSLAFIPEVMEMGESGESGELESEEQLNQDTRRMYKFAASSNSTILLRIRHAAFGAACGIALHFIIFDDLGFDTRFTIILTALASTLLAIGSGLSTFIRCVCTLMIPRLCGKTGRRVLKTMALALIFTGPIANIMVNIKEVARVFGCTTQLTYNLSIARYNLMVEPFQEALMEIRHDRSQVLTVLDTVDDVIEPILEEVEDDSEVEGLRAESDYLDMVEGDSPRSQEIERKYKVVEETRKKRELNESDSDADAEFFEMEYKRKVEYRCEGVINTGTERCRDLFRGAYDKCYNAVSVVAAWLLCWPMKLTFICNLVSVFGGRALCSADTVVEPGFGKGFASLKNTKKYMTESMGDVKLKYSLKGKLPKVDMKGAGEMAHNTAQNFYEKKLFYDRLIQYLRWVLAAYVLVVIVNTVNYVDKYLSDINFDNNYITQYFLKIDNRRQLQRHRYLLPLKKAEAKKFVDVRSNSLTKTEVVRVIKSTLLLIIELFPSLAIILTDYVLDGLLRIIERNAYVEFVQKGSHDISVNVTGVGVVANVVRSLVKGLNVKRKINVVHSNATCLPKSSTTPSYYMIKIALFYGATWIMVLLDGYIIRLNRAICAHYYPKREKRRILFKYNETLKRRILLYRHTFSKVKIRINEFEKQRKTNFFLSIRLRRPKYFDWLRFFSVAQLSCVICEEAEPWNGENFVRCRVAFCPGHFCIQCWDELDRSCYVCSHYHFEPRPRTPS